MSQSEVPGRAELVARLRARGLRVTAPRLAVLASLVADGHPAVDDLTARVRGRLGAVSQQAVYDVLHAFERAGLVRRVEPAGHPARYETRIGDNHHHLVCTACGAITDVDCAVGDAPCLHPADDAGYRIEQADITYWGLCPTCQPHTPAIRPS